MFSKYKADTTKLLNEKIDKIWPPPIPFKVITKLPKRSKKTNSPDDDDEGHEEKEKTRSFDIAFAPDDSDSETYTRKVRVFENGTPEDWVKHRIEVSDLFTATGFTTADKQLAVWRSLFDDKAKDLFRSAYNRRSTENQALQLNQQVDHQTVIKRVLNDVAKKVFGNNWSNAARRQKSYMRKNLRMGEMNPEKFFDRLGKLNSYLP